MRVRFGYTQGTMTVAELQTKEAWRGELFPVVRERTFLAHAGVAPLPQAAVDAIMRFCASGSVDAQENADTWATVRDARATAGRLLGCAPDEIALLGPTALGLSLVANGLDWRLGDEVLYYHDDYPANVYPWLDLERHGVKPARLRTRYPGVITWEGVEAALRARTRLVALASCHFLSGYRIDVEGIGRRLRERGILFCVDGIQTLGAFPLRVQHVDFLSADSHKWLLGPAGAGILYVRKGLQDSLRPTLLGSWNVFSPQFVAQDELRFYEGARRYEPGMLNLPGIAGMLASMELLMRFGIDAVAERILELRRTFLEMVRPMGYRLYLEEYDAGADATDATRSGIISLTHLTQDLKELARTLQAANTSVSLRQNRHGEDLLRFSPHFYNTEEELARTAELMKT